MLIIFYISGIISIITSFCIIISRKPMYALIYMIVSLLSIACIFFSLGSYFAGALEIIIYAGAIMVLFIFVIMMFNINNTDDYLICINFKEKIHVIKQVLISIMLLIIFLYSFFKIDVNINFSEKIITIKHIGIKLFESYILAVELVSILLLAGLLIVFHFGYNKKIINIKSK